MRFLLLGCILSFAVTGRAQFSSDELKYVIVMGNQVRMASDMLDRDSKEEVKYGSNISALETLHRADYQMLAGKINNAIGSYYGALSYYLPREEAGDDKEITPVTVFSISSRKDKRLTYAEVLMREVMQGNWSKDDWFTISRALNGIAIYYHQQGNLLVAEKLYLQVLNIRGTQGSKTSEHYVAALHNLGVLRKDQGRYNASEDILKYVISFLKAKRSVNSSQYIVALNNQAMLEAEIGRLEKANGSIDQILLNQDKIIFSSSSYDLSRIKLNLSLLQLEKGDVEQAYSTITKLIAAYPVEKRNRNIDLLLAELYQRKIELSMNPSAVSSEILNDLATKIGKRLGEESMMYADARILLGDYYLKYSNFAKASEAYDQAAVIKITELGKEHLDYLKIVNKQALTYWEMGELQNAYVRFEVAAKTYLGIIDKFFYNMSEKEKFKFWQAISPEIDLFFNFAAENATTNPEAVRLALEVRLITKGLLLNNSNKILNAINETNDQELKKMYSDWVSIKKDLSTYYSFGEIALKEMQIDIPYLEETANSLEKKINLKASGAFVVNEKPVGSEQIISALQNDEAAVEIIRLNGQNPKYGAWVIGSQALQFIMIDEAEELESKMIRYYKNMIRLKRADNLSYDAFWSVIATKVNNYAKLYISVDGVYNLINLNSLQKDGQFVIEEQVIELVPNSGSIVRPAQEQELTSKALLIGNPTFSEPSITPLPGTAIELQKISELLSGNSIDTEVYTKEAASEDVLKKSSNPAIVHIATHGFFIGDKPTKEAIIAGSSIKSDNPLLRSGLLLAGAGAVNMEDQAKDADGIFTAYDGINLPLLQTELVVLSACETGTGEVVNGEGVYGLSRAFSVAGARHVVLSLWKVDDTATQQLMTMFYTNWLNGEDIKLAFLNAQLALKEKFPAPYYWSAFVMINNN